VRPARLGMVAASWSGPLWAGGAAQAARRPPGKAVQPRRILALAPTGRASAPRSSQNVPSTANERTLRNVPPRLSPPSHAVPTHQPRQPLPQAFSSRLSSSARWEPRCHGSRFPRGGEVALVSPFLRRNGSARKLQVGRVAPAEPVSVECRPRQPTPCFYAEVDTRWLMQISAEARLLS
jgi:hypothetical protein